MRYKYTVTPLWFKKVYVFAPMKHLNSVETVHQNDFDYTKNFTHTNTFSENDNFYIPLYRQWPGQHNCNKKFRCTQFIINFIRISSVVLVYQTGFDHSCNGNLAIILCTLVRWQYNWINRFNILN